MMKKMMTVMRMVRMLGMAVIRAMTAAFKLLFLLMILRGFMTLKILNILRELSVNAATYTIINTNMLTEKITMTKSIMFHGFLR